LRECSHEQDQTEQIFPRRLTAPSTEPAGGILLSKADGPLSTSMRSNMLGRGAIKRCHAVQAIELHIITIGSESTDGIAVPKFAAHATVEYGRVGRRNHIADFARLNIRNELVGIADGGKRCFHPVLIAQQDKQPFLVYT